MPNRLGNIGHIELKANEVNKMEKTNKNENKSTWAIGGGVLLGIGVGFFFLRVSPLAFVGCILGGLGLGLMITSIISGAKGNK